MPNSCIIGGYCGPVLFLDSKRIGCRDLLIPLHRPHFGFSFVSCINFFFSGVRRKEKLVYLPSAPILRLRFSLGEHAFVCVCVCVFCVSAPLAPDAAFDCITQVAEECCCVAGDSVAARGRSPSWAPIRKKRRHDAKQLVPHCINKGTKKKEWKDETRASC